jgi:hypothetical protein
MSKPVTWLATGLQRYKKSIANLRRLLSISGNRPKHPLRSKTMDKELYQIVLDFDKKFFVLNPHLDEFVRPAFSNEHEDDAPWTCVFKEDNEIFSFPLYGEASL